MSKLRLCWSVLAGVVVVLSALSTHAAEPPLRVAYFQADVTPPMGTPLCCGGNNPPAAAVDDPLSARGLVLLPQGQAPIVICAVDWVGIANESHDAWRAALADAAGTTADRVAVQALHQHDAPEDDQQTEAWLAERGMGGLVHNAEFCEEARANVADAVRKALRKTKPVTAVGVGTTEVDRVASNRRILGPDGKVVAVRWTATKDPAVRAEPEGTIDPLVKCISLWNKETPVAVLTYYATHPQSHYGKGRVSTDFVGMARALRESAMPDLPHIHFNGAAGNIGAGKYNDGEPANRAVLADRLADGMRRAWDATVKTPLEKGDIAWHLRETTLPVRTEIDDVSEQATLDNVEELKPPRIAAASELAFRKRMAAGHGIPITRLKLGPVDLLQLPGELFVEYQLAAQSMQPGRTVCMAAYGDYGPGYIGTAISYEQGGYETQLYTSRTSPAVEVVLMDAIKGLLEE